MTAVWPPDLEMKADIPQMFDNDGGDQILIVGRSQKTGTIASVEFVPNWTRTGADTNSRTFTLFNRRSDGLGTTTVAQLVFTSGASMTQFVAKSLSMTAGNRALAVGDILEWESLHVGNGLPDPGGKVIVQFALT